MSGSLQHHVRWVTGTRALALLAAAVLNVGTARILSPRDFAGFLLVMSGTVIASAGSRWGMNQVAVAEISRLVALDEHGIAQAVARRLWKRSVLQSLAIATATLLLPADAWMVVSAGLGDLLVRIAIALAVVAETARTVAAEAMRGFGYIRKASVSDESMRNSAALAFLFLGYLSGENGGTLLLASLAWAGGCALLAGSSTCMLFRVTRMAAPRVESTSGATLNRRIWIVGLASIAGMVLIQGDIWVGGVFLSEDDLAAYGLASRISGLLATPLYILVGATAWRVPHWYRQGALALEERLRAIATIALAATLAMIFMLEVLGPRLIPTLLGPQYTRSLPLIRILMIGQIISAFAGICGASLLALRDDRHFRMVSVAVVLMALLAGSLASHSLGSVGLAVAWSAALACLNIALSWRLATAWCVKSFATMDLRHVQDLVRLGKRHPNDS